MAGKYIGGFTVGGAIPVALVATAAASATANAALIPAQARLAGSIQAAAAVTFSPPSAAAVATLAAAAAASVVAALAAPTVGASAGVAAELVAELGGIVLALEAQLRAIARIEALLGTAGIHMYTTEGEVGSMGTDLHALVAGGVPGGTPEDIGFGVFLVASADPAAASALRTVFGV